MKTQNSSETTQPLLNDTDKESGAFDEFSEDFLKQNDIINQEIIKNNNLLKTLPMVIYRAWLILYAFFLFVAAFFVPVYEISEMVDSNYQILTEIFGLIALATLFTNLAAIYGCILMSTALFSKQLSKANKAITLFRISAGLSFILNGMFIFMAYIKSVKSPLTWTAKILLLLQGAIALINLWPSIYAKDVLVKREVFCQVSSSTNNPT